MKNILLIGSGAREHALAKAIKQSRQPVNLQVLATSHNPGIKELSDFYQVVDIKDVAVILRAIDNINIEVAVIGPEAPLVEGLVDELEKLGIVCFGPKKILAQLEGSKSFTRELLREYNITASPVYQVVTDISTASQWINSLDKEFVIKPDGLTGGKGVKVQGDHFSTPAQGLDIVEKLIASDGRVVIEEKLIGQEFSLMSITDGVNFLHLPAVQDHKRALAGDKGPNTGGMGSYSCQDFSLPFLSKKDIITAQSVNQQVTKALLKKYNIPYQGVLYGGFIATARGVKLIEYNVRFGDPEAMNVLSLLQNDFVDILSAVSQGELNKIKPDFKPMASVCKYVVPDGYPVKPVKDEIIDVSQVDTSKVDIFYAAVDQRTDGLYMTGSRALALVGLHSDLYTAEKMVEEEIKKIKGPVFHRQDIGTKELIEKRVEMMKSLRK